VRTLSLEAVTNLVEEGGVVMSHGLEGVLRGHTNLVRGGLEVSTRASVRHRAGREVSETLSLNHRGEGDDLVHTLEDLAISERDLVHREDIVVPAEEEVLAVLGLSRLNLGEELDGHRLSSLLQSAAKSLNLVEGEVVVIATEKAEDEGVDSAVSLAADSVLDAHGLPRLLPRDSAAFESEDELVSEDICDSYFGGGGGHMRGGRCN